ncbi:MAG: AAA family ATPase [Hyphomicrobiales bacterium]|nr:AAA family ATPase [Hyphomicrobiales bacterium]
MAAIRLNLIGGMQIADGAGRPLALGAKKARALLAFLALHPGQAQSRDKLAALLWEDRDEAQARTSLRQALAALRKALAEADPAGGADLLVADGETVCLPSAAAEVDVRALQDAVADGAVERLADLARAAPGALMDGFDPKAPAFDDWLRAERQRVDGLVNDGLTTLLDHHQRAGELERAAHVAARILARDPLREDVHRALMRIYAGQGRHALALKQYRLCQDVLRRELGVAPDPETQALRAEVEGQRRAPAPEAPAPGLPGADAADAADEAATAATAAEPAAPAAPRAPFPAPASPEKRQATVMFADISGFTDLGAEMDPEDLHDLVSRFFAAVDGLVVANGGTVHRHIGDNVMAVFGVPTAHSNDPLRAVRTALQVHAAMPALSRDLGVELTVHVGIAGGPVILSSDGGEERFTGDAPNLAARLTDLAAAGETLVDDATRLALGDRLAGDDLGARPVKGFRAPVRIFRAREVVEPDTAGRLFPFVGRTAERLQFEGVVRSCAATGGGMTVYLRGPAGMGKTRLSAEFEHMARDQGFATHRALVLDFGAGSERRALSALFEGLAADAGDCPLAQAECMFLDELLGREQPAESRRLLDAMDQQARDRGFRTVMAQMVRWATGQRPRLLLVEDIHWADPWTLNKLAHLSGLMAEVPAILVLTARTETDPLDRAWREGAQTGPMITLDLSPLRENEARELGQAMEEADPGFLDRCIERAAGNPLYLEQLLRSAAETDTDVVPGSVQSIVLARMDALDDADRQALRAASVVGQGFTLDVVAHLLQDPGYRPDTLLREVFVRPEGTGFLFAHALVRDAVYASLLKSQRTALHQRAAAWYAGRDRFLHAQHLEAAGDPRAAEAFLDAARFEFNRSHLVNAGGLAARGRELADRLRANAHEPAERRGTRHALACLHGEILRDLGEVEASIAAFQASLPLARTREDRARSWLGMATGWRVLDRYDEGLAALDTAEGEARDPDDPALLAEVHYMRGNLHFPLSHLDECLAAHEQALVFARQAGSVVGEAAALSGLGDAHYLRGNMNTAFDLFDRCVRLCQEKSFLRLEIGNLPMRAILHLFRLEPRAAQDDVRAAIEAARRVGNRRGEMLARDSATLAAVLVGDLEDALYQAEKGLSLVRRIGAYRFESDFESQMAKSLWLMGDRARAAQLAETAISHLRPSDERFIGPSAMGVLALTTPDPDRRRWALEDGERMLDLDCACHNHMQFNEMAIDAALAAGDWDRAEGFAARLDAYTAAEPVALATLLAARARELAALGRGAGDLPPPAPAWTAWPPRPRRRGPGLSFEMPG